MNIEQARETIERVKIKLRAGADYYACKEEAQPAIDTINERAKEIAKEYGKKFKPFTFTYLMR